jgi:hypothetical protein
MYTETGNDERWLEIQEYVLKDFLSAVLRIRGDFATIENGV